MSKRFTIDQDHGLSAWIIQDNGSDYCEVGYVEDEEESIVEARMRAEAIAECFTKHEDELP